MKKRGALTIRGLGRDLVVMHGGFRAHPTAAAQSRAPSLGGRSPGLAAVLLLHPLLLLQLSKWYAQVDSILRQLSVAGDLRWSNFWEEFRQQYQTRITSTMFCICIWLCGVGLVRGWRVHADWDGR